MKDSGILSAVGKGRGGIHVPYHKNTQFMEAKPIPAPATVTLPMIQHIGAPCTPLVQVGDEVKVGQKIGDTDKFVSAPVHASVSGKVTAVGPIKLASGLTSVAVTIASDGLMTPWEGIEPPHVTTKEELLKAVRESGLVGLGGAGFPTHVKLNVPPDKKIDTLIINAAECEPYITVDYREALDNSWDILSGVFTVSDLMQIPHVIIAVEDNKPDAIKVLKAIAEKDDEKTANVEIMTLKSKYPQGAEKMIVYSATGRKVPAGGLPADVGCIVMNVTSIAFLSRYLKTGMPLVSRSITVDGDAIKTPQNLRVPIGMKLADIVAYCGGFVKEPEKVISGGPMMGLAIYNLEAPLCKQNNALLAFTKAEVKKERACINCGKCVQACPMSLTPTFIMKAVKAKNTEKLNTLNTMVCMECGCCAYSCPSGIPLVQYLRLGKQLLKEEKK